ncbi:hypothetical protein F5X71_34825 [Nocardia brasiliensis]|uniref:Uncharacterized protein n=1 Tax=Nocardia brasiliensis TaxID=37326 RepID=A0A6G9Y0Z9_NOCBR|nr:hypothetical protein [Nocardia brasiliensis]QIS06800.1 hypothetical protein F5X71_34825 [Nocardia brasiliensis]
MGRFLDSQQRYQQALDERAERDALAAPPHCRNRPAHTGFAWLLTRFGRNPYRTR